MKVKVGDYVIIADYIPPSRWDPFDSGELLLTDSISKVIEIENGNYKLEDYNQTFEAFQIVPLNKGINLMREDMREGRERIRLYKKYSLMNKERKNETDSKKT